MPRRFASTPRSVGPSLNGLRVLVVEDHADSRLLSRQMLESFGARVLLAEDGRQACDLLESETPDLILCDVHMPRMDGFAFVRHVRADRRHARTPVVAITALGADADDLRTLEAGFDAHVVKPIDVETIVAVLRRFSEWRRRRAARALPRSTGGTGRRPRRAR